MRIINTPPLTDEPATAEDTDDLINQRLAGITTDITVPQLSQPFNGQATALTGDVSRFYRQMELKLESVVEGILLSKLDERDNILANMQSVMERMFVTSAMRMAQGNISRAARLLGINRNTLSKKLKALGVRG